MMGSGGMIVMDDRTCMVDVARYFLAFLEEESCGKCVPCREGLKQMLHIYGRLIAGDGTPGDIERIERLAAGMQLGSLCELGKTAPNPVLSTLRYFRDEYEAHIHDRTLPGRRLPRAHRLRDQRRRLRRLPPLPKACPVDAISGVIKELHVIDNDICISCGACLDVCPTDAVRTFPRRS